MNCKPVTLLACATLALGLATTVSAESLKVNFSSLESPHGPSSMAAMPEPGWEDFVKAADLDFPDVTPVAGQTETYNTPLGVAGTVDVTLFADTDNNHFPGVFPQWRNRNALLSEVGLEIGPNMLASRWGVSSIPEGQCNIPLSIQNLVNGMYDLTIYHHEQNGTAGVWDEISVNGVTQNDIMTSLGDIADPIGRSDWQFEVTNNTATILFTKSEAGGAEGEANVNGFELALVGADSTTERAWNVDASGDWNTMGHWTPTGVPDANDQTATLGGAITSPRVVFTETDVTVKGIQFLSGMTYAVAGTGSVNLEGVSGVSNIEVLLGNHQFQAEVNVNNDTTVSLAGDASLEFVNRLNLNGNRLTVTGDGTLLVNNSFNTGAGTIVGASGTIAGGGVVGGDLVNDGVTLQPGNNASALLAVPEPTTCVLFVMGVMTLSIWTRRAGVGASR